MMSTTENISGSYKIAAKVKDYFQLIKFTLSFTVVFSCVICYLLAPDITYNFKMVIFLFVAGMLVTGSANAINQAVEKDTDAMMKRTGKRPVADGRMSQQEAYTFAFIAGVVGVLMMWQFFNLLSALLSAFSLVFICIYLYALKKGKFNCGISRGFSRCIALSNWMGSRYRMNLVQVDGYYLVFSFYGSFRIFGQLPGLHTKIIAKQVLNCYLLIKDQQSLQHCSQLCIRC